MYINLVDGGTYYKIAQSIPPESSEVPLPTGTVHHVGFLQPAPYNTIQGAVDSGSTLNGDSLW